MFGYPSQRKAQGVHDELTVSALAYEYDGLRAMMVSASVLGFRDFMVSEMRKLIFEATGIPAENVILSATHTHSGPVMWDWEPSTGNNTNKYLEEIFYPGVAAAVKQAVSNMQPALVGIGVTQSDVGINRRQLEQDGSVLLGNNPWGIYDPIMTVISFKSADGSPIANLVHYGYHCTSAGINYELTRDWPGPMIDRLEEQSGALTIFFNGPEGDIGPRLTNGNDKGAAGAMGGDISQTMELGARAANDAVCAWRSIREYREMPLSLVTGEIKLPYSPLLSEEEAKAKLKSLEGIAELDGQQKADQKMCLSTLEVLASGNPIKTHLEYLQTLVAIGPVVFVPFPFEVFTEIGIRLRHYSPFQHTLSLSCTNGYNSYFPSLDQVSRGGYEVRSAFSTKAYRLVQNADHYVINANMQLINQL